MPTNRVSSHRSLQHHSRRVERHRVCAGLVRRRLLARRRQRGRAIPGKTVLGAGRRRSRSVGLGGAMGGQLGGSWRRRRGGWRRGGWRRLSGWRRLRRGGCRSPVLSGVVGAWRRKRRRPRRRWLGARGGGGGGEGPTERGGGEGGCASAPAWVAGAATPCKAAAPSDITTGSSTSASASAPTEADAPSASI